MARCARVGLIGMVLLVSGCSVFTDVFFSSFRVGPDDDLSAAERRERNEASRERVSEARVQTDSYERKRD